MKIRPQGKKSRFFSGNLPPKSILIMGYILGYKRIVLGE